MRTFIVIAVYRSEIGGEAGGSRDFRGIFVKANSDRQAITKVYSQKVEKYKNTDGEWVKWPLVEIMSCGELSKCVDLEEVAGFIAGKNELYGPPSLNTPTLSAVLSPQRSATSGH